MRIRKKTLAIVLTSAVAMMIFGDRVEAQQPDLQDERGVPVHQRSRPELNPLGLRAGGFTLRPSLQIGATYDDNIFATRRNRREDLITTVTPHLQVESDWSRHQVQLDLGATAGFYAKNTSEDYIDAIAAIQGRLDILRDTYLLGQLSYARRHEDRGDPDVPLANDEPSIFYLTNARVEGFRGAGLLSLQLGATFSRYSFRSVELVDGSRRSQSGRDRNIYEVDSRVAYELLPNVRPFIEGRYNWRRYDSRSPINRDSEGFRIGIGSGFDLGGIITGELFAGYLRQNYKASARDTASGPWFGGSVLWNATRLTSVQLGLVRSVEETQRGDASSFTRSAFTSRVDHELLRNLLIGTFFNYTDDRYNGVNINDRFYEGGPRATYLWNRNFTAELSFTHRRKGSNLRDRRYRDNRVFFAVTGSF